MSDKFSEFNAAVRMREAMKTVVRDVLNTMYPPPRFAICVSVDTATRKATCQYPGETTTFSLAYGAVAPFVGSTVRVNGQAGGRYIDEVFNRPIDTAGPLDALRRAGIVSNESGAGWVGPAFANGYSNYGGGYNAAAYRRVDSSVELKGLVKPPLVTALASYSTIFTLPAGFRPRLAQLLTGHCYDRSLTPSFQQACRITVFNDGRVTYGGSFPSSSSSQWVSLDGLRFTLV